MGGTCVRNVYEMLFSKAEGKKFLIDLGVHGRIILKWILSY
jgi:hypothetical protein